MMARLPCLLALCLAACPQEIDPLLPPLEPPDADAPTQDAGGPQPGRDSGAAPDAATPGHDAGPPPATDARPADLGACGVSPSPARVNQEVTITCEAQASMSGPGWAVEGVDGGHALTAGAAAGTATFMLQQVPKNFADTTLQVRATWHGASGDGLATASVPVLGNLWVSKAATPPAITAFTTSPDYQKQTDVVGVTEFDRSPRALGLLANGDVLVAQDVRNGAPPVIVIGRAELERTLDYEATSGGQPIFDPAKYANPRAVMQMSDGTVWVTGGALPAIYHDTGKFKGRPSAATRPSGNTVGLAQLSTGEVAVTLNSLKIGLYSLDGSAYQERDVLDGGAGYSNIQAILALAEGGAVLSLNRFQSGDSGGMLVQLDATWGHVRETPSSDWLYQETASHIVRVGDEFITTPPLDTVSGAYLRRYGPDLKKRANVGTGTLSPRYSGVVRLR